MAQLSEITATFQSLQDEICRGLEVLDGSGRVFQEDTWKRPSGGGGRTRVFTGGKLIEKGGVNFSHVHGPMPAKISQRLSLPEGTQFHATGVSIVLHSSHPFVPTIHLNIRYFETYRGHHWFGGGIDVTPAYIIPEQARQFHGDLKVICDGYRTGSYLEFKQWCDRYFFLPHRDETRGIGGIFFDHLAAKSSEEKVQNWAFVQAVGKFFVPAYTQLAEPNRQREFSESHRQWQFYRRGRYVEFNLLWDKGTKFGVDTGGRTESILMSLPPTANWIYAHQPEPGSAEAQTMGWLKPINWLDLEKDPAPTLTDASKSQI
ncbi:MAG: oxygen-dependent coproporphyrinogen oxidase [Bacteroidota bacterium]